MDAIGLKQSKRRRKRQEERKLSKKSMKKTFAEKYKINHEIVNNKHTKKLTAISNQVHEYRKRAVHFWGDGTKKSKKIEKICKICHSFCIYMSYIYIYIYL